MGIGAPGMDDQRILDQFPLPIARGYRRYLNAAEVRQRHDDSYFLYEIYIKYAASTAIAYYLAGEKRDHRVNAALKGLTRPSLGEWLRFLRECLRFHSERVPDGVYAPAMVALAEIFSKKERRWTKVVRLYNSIRSLCSQGPSEKEQVSLEMLLGEIVAYRNRVLGHGAPLDTDHYGNFCSLLADAYGELLEQSPYLVALRLVSFDSIRIDEGTKVECDVVEFLGDLPTRRKAPHVIRYGDPVPPKEALHLMGDDGRFVSLDPLLLSHRDDVYFLNEAQGIPEYLSYSTGDRYTPEKIGEAQRMLFQRILGYEVDGLRLSRMGDDVAPPAIAPSGGESLKTEEGERRFGDYRIRREIGRGGMGTVFEAIQESLGRRVALKVLPGSFALDPKRVERFRREARATARIHHPNIVPVYEVGEDQGTHYYTMEYVDGTSLDELLERARADTAAKEPRRGSSTSDPAYIAHAVEQIAAVADGLQEAHELGLIHRDVKPSNLLVDRDGRYVLVDFGLVHETDAQTLTRSGEMIGTLSYMPPEQVSRSPVDRRADIYSLGMTLYEILTLRVPFERRTEHETQRAILFEEPAPPRRFNPRLNRDLETILLRALEKNPERRYATAGAMASDLRRFLRYEPIEARPLSGLTRLARRIWRHRGKVAAAAAILVLLLTTASLLLWINYKNYLERVKNYEPSVLREVLRMQMGRLNIFEDVAEIGSPLEGDTQRGVAHALAQGKGLEPIQEAVRRLGEIGGIVGDRPEAFYHQARGFLLLGRSEEALRSVEQSIASQPDFIPAIILKSAILKKRGDLPGAQEVRESVQRLRGSGWTEHWLEAQEAREERRWDDVADALGKLIELEIRGKPPYLGSSVETRLGRGRAYLKARDFEKAEEDFLQAKGIWSRSLEPSLLLGMTRYVAGHEEKAEETFEELFRIASSRDDAAIGIVSIYGALHDYDRAIRWTRKVAAGLVRDLLMLEFLLVTGKLDEALDLAKKTVTEHPKSSRGRFTLGKVYGYLGNRKKVRKAYSEAFRLDPGDPEICDFFSWVLERSGELEEAERLLKRAIDLDPGFHGSLGQYYYRRGMWEDALEEVRKAIEVNPTSGQAHNLYQRTLAGLGRVDEAIEMYQKALARNPDDGFTLYQLARILSHHQEKPAEALPLFERALALNPRLYFAHRELGDILRNLGRLEEAVSCYERALEIHPYSQGIRMALGEAYLAQGRSEEGLALLRAILRQVPVYYAAEDRIRNVFRNQGRLEELILEYQKAAERLPESGHVRYFLAGALEFAGRYQDAIEACKKVIDNDPYQPGVHCRRAFCEAQLGDLDSAEESFQRSLNLYPMGGWAWFGLGYHVHLPRKKVDEAIEAIQKGIELVPDNVYMREELAQIYRNQGRVDDAMREYLRLIRMEPFGAASSHRNLWALLREKQASSSFAPELTGFLEDLEEIRKAVGSSQGNLLNTLALGWSYHPGGRDSRQAETYARLAVLSLEEALELPGAIRELWWIAEECRGRLSPDLVSYRTIDSALAASQMEVSIPRGATWRYFPGKEEPSGNLEWTLLEFDDETWKEGPSGFGYGDDDDETLLGDMRYNYTTVYIRHTFTENDPASIQGLRLLVISDDGFVAYLNGTEVGRLRASSASKEQPWDAVANRTIAEAVPGVFWIDPSLLRSGKNCLAIQGLNATKESSDFSLIPILEVKRPVDPAKDRKLLEDFRKFSEERGEDARNLLADLEGRILQRAGDHEAAVKRFEEAISRDASRPEPFLRLAESLCAQGKADEAVRILGTGHEIREVWNRWLEISFGDLELEPSEVLRRFETLPRAAGADEVRWCLQWLALGGTLRINCGGETYSGPEGSWNSDRFFAGGRVYGDTTRPPESSTGEIEKPEALYRTNRWFPEDGLHPAAYRIPLPKGRYDVTLHFAELYYREPGRRVFHVLVEGARILEDLDVLVKAGFATAYKHSARGIEIRDGVLDIDFRGRVGDPMISGIEIQMIK